MNSQRQLPLYEPFSIPAAFVEEVSAIATFGSITHLIFASRQAESDGGVARIVQARLIVPTDRLQAIAKAMLAGQVAVAPSWDGGEPVALH